MKCNQCKMPLIGVGIDRCFCEPALVKKPASEIPEYLREVLDKRDGFYLYIAKEDDCPLDRAEIPIDDAYRLMDLGEVVKEGDEYFHCFDLRWTSCAWGIGLKVDPDHVPHRRRIEK